MLMAVRNFPGGDYAECGVYKGHTAEMIHSHMDPKAMLFLFDSFAGHAEPTEFDDPVCHPKGRYSDNSIEEVRKLCPRAIIVAGFIPETFAGFDGHVFRFVHIDVDHYLPTKAASEFFKARMVPGGIIRFDDYGCGGCEGATKAIDEVFGRENILSGDSRWIFVDK